MTVLLGATPSRMSFADNFPGPAFRPKQETASPIRESEAPPVLLEVVQSAPDVVLPAAGKREVHKRRPGGMHRSRGEEEYLLKRRLFLRQSKGTLVEPARLRWSAQPVESAARAAGPPPVRPCRAVRAADPPIGVLPARAGPAVCLTWILFYSKTISFRSLP